jgi:uncharacterized protein YidB (DUF937 family)
MTPYIHRPHDELLRAVLDPAMADSRLVVVRGGSSTGKTRAAYEAVIARLADWRLEYPRNAAALEARLDAGIPARTVLWLGELRQYADDDGGVAALGRLADLLEGTGHVLITTVWPEHWTAYTAAARAGPGTANPSGVVGRLLALLPELTGSDPARIDPCRGGVIDIPPRFTSADLTAAVRTGNPVLAGAAAAAAAAGQDGEVTQYLAGVPDLLDRYAGPGADPYGQAVITAAMDATRLGHASPLPAVLLQQAAIGYLTAQQRTADITSWRESALNWATAELNGAVRALQPVPPPSGTGIAGYQVADYLDQHARRTRQDQPGPPSLWAASSTDAATPRDRVRLGQAARARGLYRYAAALLTTATAQGSTDAARRLIALLRQVSPDDTMIAIGWAAGLARLDRLDNPASAARMLQALREGGVDDAARTLASQAAADARLVSPGAAASLLGALRAMGADDAVRTLASQAAADARLDNLGGVGRLVQRLRRAGARDAAAALASRAAADVRLDDPAAVGRLVQTLRRAGARDAAAALASRAAADARLDNLGAVASLLRALHAMGADDAARTLASRAAEGPLDSLGAVASLLRALRAMGADDAARTLASRAAADAGLDNSGGVGRLLQALHEAGADDAATTLASRAAADAPLENPWVVASLLQALHEAGADDAASTLAYRAAADAPLDNPGPVGRLLGTMRAMGARGAATTLAYRAAADAHLDSPEGVARLLRIIREMGAGDAVAALLARDPASHARLDDPGSVASLMRALREAGAGAAAAILANRVANAGMFDLFLRVCPGEASDYKFGREPDGTPSRPWRWQAPEQSAP